MTRLHTLAGAGQAIWFDYIRRSFIVSGELQGLIDQGVRGVTSNPSIFEKAIAGSTDYDEDLHELVDAGRSVDEIYEALVLDDIGRAADLMRPVYDETKGVDGYVSLEVSPTLAHDTAGTVADARRLWAALGRPNIMIKVPATPAGVPAIETLIAEGINVNVTLIFSTAQYEAVANAYIAGLEKRAKSGGDIGRVASVASFFVSRVDSAVDKLLERIEGGQAVMGKAAIANAKVAYARFRELFSGPRWDALAGRGAMVQRQLWASTGTKNPMYSDTLYVDSLIGRDTVNTVPPATLQAFVDHGRIMPTLAADVEEAEALLARLGAMGIDLDKITQDLQDGGVLLFAKSFEALMSSIAEKREKLLGGWDHHDAGLGTYQGAVGAALAEMAEQQIAARIWAGDYTVWKPDPTEITNRLGWLQVAESLLEDAPRIQALAKPLRQEGYTHALLLGMGGSSLAPEVFRKTFGVGEGYLDLAVLDSTDPDAVLAHADRLDMRKTLFVVSTKSGGTVETFSFFKFFYNRVASVVGPERAGEHFIAITDPGSGLADTAARYKFRMTFLNNPNIGGRYSALSHFGIVPATLVGVDVPRLLDRALRASASCEGCVPAADNPGLWLGAIMGELATAGRDKLTIVTSPAIASFGDWVEQLIAESTGKEGRGLLPVVGEALLPPSAYANDRLFVHLRLEDDETHDAALGALAAAGHPVVTLRLHDPYDLGSQMFVWEFATAVAGQRIAINPFDQPNVESAKVLARQMVAAYQKEGKLPELTPELKADGITVFGDVSRGSLRDVLKGFLGPADQGKPSGAGRSYVSFQAYVPPTAATDAAMQALRTTIQAGTRMATTTGYGPRFLHSTGQLHKGDAGRGLFIQIVSGDGAHVPIPDEAGAEASSIDFGTLKMAQSLGDRQALLNAGRRVLRFEVGRDVPAALKRLTEALS